MIAGLGLLAVELAQNNELLTAEARSTRAAVRNEMRTLYLENPNLVQLLVDSQRQETLTGEEEVQLRFLMSLTLNNLQYVYIEYQEGLIDESDLGIVGWRSIYHRQYPGMPELWGQIKGSYRPDFVDYFEENVVTKPPEIESFF